MKKLSDLGTSPTPWKLCRDGEIVHGDGYSLTDGDGCFVLKSDARLVAAAPKMYAVIWDVCFGQSNTVNCAKCGGDCHGGVEYCSKTCPLYNARAALAEAAGEIEAK